MSGGASIPALAVPDSRIGERLVFKDCCLCRLRWWIGLSLVSIDEQERGHELSV
jgi:hypothetical protein